MKRTENVDSLKITQTKGPAHVGAEWDICSINEEGGATTHKLNALSNIMTQTMVPSP